MGKHERPAERNILDAACEIAEAIDSVQTDGVIAFYLYAGIALTPAAFMEHFTEWKEEKDDKGTLMTAEYKGRKFCAYVVKC